MRKFNPASLFEAFGLEVPDDLYIYYEEDQLNIISCIPGPFRGQSHTRKTKQSISKSLTGRTLSEETKRKIGLASRGRGHTEEIKKIISQKKKGRVPWNKGKKFGPLSDEVKQQLSEKMKGKRHTEETKKKISETKSLRRLGTVDVNISNVQG